MLLYTLDNVLLNIDIQIIRLRWGSISDRNNLHGISECFDDSGVGNNGR